MSESLPLGNWRAAVVKRINKRITLSCLLSIRNGGQIGHCHGLKNLCCRIRRMWWNIFWIRLGKTQRVFETYRVFLLFTPVSSRVFCLVRVSLWAKPSLRRHLKPSPHLCVVAIPLPVMRHCERSEAIFIPRAVYRLLRRSSSQWHL